MIGEIDSARDGANDGSEDVPDQRIHDRPEGCADDHADGEIDRVPAQSKFLEFLDHHRLLAAAVAGLTLPAASPLQRMRTRPARTRPGYSRIRDSPLVDQAGVNHR